MTPLLSTQRRRFSFALIALIAIVISLYFYLRPEDLLPSHDISPEIQTLLTALGDSALIHDDVPISAVILYHGTVIGEGYNTVVRDTNPAGHAEINALSSAIRRFGMAGFDRLNRDSLVLVSTYEPCPMCREAIALYRIKSVEFLKEKSIDYRLKEDLRSFVYRFRERKSDPASLQDSLFRKHPDFSKQNH